MSFLKHLLKSPLKIAKSILDPGDIFGGGHKVSPQVGVGQSMNDPSMLPDTSSGYYGQPDDPEFGSFSKPFGVEEFYQYGDPGYAFQLQQGTQALQNSAAAGSGAMSGAALKDLLKYNQDYAGTAYNDAFNRYQTQQGNIFSRLSTLLQAGQNAASGVGTTGTQLAGNAGQALTQAGAASGAGIVGAGNAGSDALTNYWLMKRFGGAVG